MKRNERSGDVQLTIPYVTYHGSLILFPSLIKFLILVTCAGTVVQLLARRTFDLEVGSSNPCAYRRVVSLDKNLYPTLSLSTQMYKWVPATKC